MQITKLNGVPVYAMSSKAYIEMRNGNGFEPNVYYVIIDKQNFMLRGNYVCGQVIDNFRRVKMIKSGDHWKKFLETDTERPLSVEEKLKSASAETENKLNTLAESGREKLNAVSKRSRRTSR